MSEFFAMGGHGPYIWGSYAVTAVFMVAEVIIAVRSKNTVLKRLARLARAEAQQQD